MNEITRKPAFWIAFAVVSALSAAFAWRYFPAALPMVNLDVKMTRGEALAQAAAISDRLDLAPPGAQSAVLFAHDGATQNFVELDAGGKPAFAAMIAGKLYSPYWWEVRLFKPGETAEAHVRFRPDGTPYGFARKVPEAEAGAALDAAAARSIAEERARTDWAVDFAPYKLLEQSQVQLPNGRIDHSFVYEREQEQLGDGRYRMRLGVAGDRLVEITHSVHVPEAFERRFQEMRFANNAIAQVAGMSAGALYGIGGCILGVLWLLRRRALIWWPALVAGAVVAGLNALALVANAPQAWFGFDTAQPVWVFWGQQFALAVLVLVGGGLALGLVFMAAESLSRRAFPQHPQLWHLWSRAAGPSAAVLGRTVAGYLAVPIELALIAAFYFVTNRYFGWWQPSESLTDPNILGSALPALAPVGMALQAGFMEECLFRAVPLSIAALLGSHFGHRKLFIAIALVLQAVVFGAAHANYPGFPSYSRLVELVGPAFVWGLIFVRFGLLTTVILHAVFDLTLMSVPVFLIEGPGGTMNQSLVIMAGLVPLAIVLVRRVRVGAWLTLPGALRNGAWQPADAPQAPALLRGRAAAGAWTARMQRALPWLGLAGLLAVALGGGLKRDTPPLVIDRGAAEAAADAALEARGVHPGDGWKRFAVARLVADDASASQWHKFVWREAGRDAYEKLVGNWLAPPLWDVRYARFDSGDVADRAEEWRVAIAGDGKVRQVRHQLPEKQAGARLSREQARTLAQQEVRQRFGLDPAALREVSADEQERPARADWQFTWTDPGVDVGKGGEARVIVAIAGDQIAGSGRYVFVPEVWQRAERQRAGRLSLAKNAVILAVIVAALAAIIATIIAWSRGHFDKRAFWLTLCVVGGAALLGGINAWPVVAMQLRTAEPLAPQVALAAASVAFSTIPLALLASLLAGVAVWAAREHSAPEAGIARLWLRGASAGFFVAGVESLAGAVARQDFPRFARYTIENAWLPWLDALVRSIAAPILGVAVTVIALHWLERWTGGWRRRRWLVYAALTIATGALAALTAQDWLAIVVAGLVGGALYTLLFATVLRFDLRLVPAFVAADAIVRIVSNAMLKGTVAGAFYAALEIAATLAVAWGLTRYLLRVEPLTARAPLPAA
ncbi:MAG TPA: CPBP family intramembrane glutamic endopeptidase [Casimicrobiaceae bacterium]